MSVLRPWYGRKTAAILLLLVACLAPAGRVYAQDVSVPPRGEFHEWLRDTEYLGSLDERVGVMAAEPNSDIREDYIYLWLAPSISGFVCVTLTSHDGYYRGKGEFELPRSRMNSRVRLHLTSRHPNVLRQYRPRGLAILAVLGPDCTSGTRPFVLASWAADANSREGVVVVASRALRTQIAEASTPGMVTRCQPTEELSRMHYDLLCPFPLRPGPRSHEFAIYQLMRDGTRPADLPVVVLSP